MWRSILTGICAIAPSVACAVHPVLLPGAMLADCRSALRIGVVSCGRLDLVVIGPEGRQPDQTGQPPAQVSDAQESEFLAQYGKPPREAVRALLDPSDTNIAAWLIQQRRVVAVASYVANRITHMQKQLDADPQWHTPTPLPELAAMIQMRATLYLKPGDAHSLDAAKALQRVVARYPSVDGQLVQVGLPSTPGLSSSLA